VLIVLAGLPGSGKTTLAEALGRLSGARVLNKDIARAALLPGRSQYSDADNDIVVERLLEQAEGLLRSGAKSVVLDGRTFSKRRQVERLRQFPLPALIVECRCSEQTALARIAAGVDHPAPDRSANLYRRLRDSADPFHADLIVDTDALAPDEAARLVERHVLDVAAGSRHPRPE
jgi:predicted kinase